MTLQQLCADVKALLEDVACNDGELASECDYITTRLDDLGNDATPQQVRDALEVTQELLVTILRESGHYAEGADALYDRVEAELQILAS